MNIHFKSKRIQQIQEYVFQNKTASLDELVEKFQVSKNIIRRDIQWLVERGEFKKVYGGVAANEGTTLVPFTDRQTRNQKEKVLIAQLASNFVEEGDIIFLDSGTTTCEMFEFLKNRELTIITNNLTFIINSLPYDNLHIISIGGTLERKTNSFTSLKKTDFFEAYNINKTFMASTGVSTTYGVTNASPVESELKKMAMAKGPTVFLLIDHEKFDKQSLMTYCKLSEIDYLVTNKTPEEKYREYAKNIIFRLCHPDR